MPSDWSEVSEDRMLQMEPILEESNKANVCLFWGISLLSSVVFLVFQDGQLSMSFVIYCNRIDFFTNISLSWISRYTKVTYTHVYYINVCIYDVQILHYVMCVESNLYPRCITILGLDAHIYIYICILYVYIYIYVHITHLVCVHTYMFFSSKIIFPVVFCKPSP